MISRALPLSLLFALSAQAAPPAEDYDALARSARRLLEELVAADTTNPPGNEARAVAIGVSRLKQAGIPHEVTEFAPGRQNLVARLAGDGSRKPLLLLAHIDVVGAEGQQWSTDPHKVTEVDGYLVGRGVADDLGMAALALEVLVALERADVPLRRDVILAWTGDEESGGEGVRYLLEHGRPSIDAEIALNEGGSPVLDEQGQVKLVSMQTAEKIYQDFEIVAKGPTGHSSVPLADNAIFRLARGLERLSGHSFPARLLPVTRAYLEKRSAVEPTEIAEAMRALANAEGDLPAAALQTLERSPVMRALLRTTCVATLLSGGTRVNALPSEARANVNCRILPDESPEEVQKALTAALGDSALEVRPTEEFGRGGSSPIEGPVPEALRKVAGELWPEAPVIPTMSLGATDSRFLRSAGIAAYGINPIANTEADARRAHGVDERIPVGSLRAGVELLHRLVLELAAAR